MSVRRGFTLIELLVVIAIIGLLSSVVLASLNSARARARYATAIEQMRQLSLATEVDYDSRGQYAADAVPAVNPGLASISGWPQPPCAGWTYDYENWDIIGGNNSTVQNGGIIPGTQMQRITMRRPDGRAVYYNCTNANGTNCGYGERYPIQDVSTRTLTCNE